MIETSKYNGYPEEELQRLLDTSCRPEVVKRRDSAIGIINKWETCLGAEAEEWERVCNILGLFMMNLCDLHMDDRLKSELNKSGETHTISNRH